MNIARVDLNLLVYLDALLREKNVTRAAQQLGITQPALSNGLKRLRTLFDDPLLVRTSDGMMPTERALELRADLSEALLSLERLIQPSAFFDPGRSQRVFRIMASDYAESTLIPRLLSMLGQQAPDITLDILTPSDVCFHDLERGRVDMAINRFDQLPQSFHHRTLWQDDFYCVLSRTNPILAEFNLKTYLAARHIWVSKTGMGTGVGVNPDDLQQLGWVDEALARLGYRRKISVLTRHYQVALLLAAQDDLVATLPGRLARLHQSNAALALVALPFAIAPIRLTLAWSPLLHHNPDHQWLRQMICTAAESGQ